MIRHHNARVLLEYWRGLARTESPPFRSSIEPRPIKTLLPNVFLLECLTSENIPFRLAGTALCALFGRELTATNFLTLWRGSGRDHVRNLVEAVLNDVGPGLIVSHGRGPDNREVELEWLLLPLKSSDGQIDRLIGCAHASKSTVSAWRGPIESQKVFLLKPPDKAAAPPPENSPGDAAIE